MITAYDIAAEVINRIETSDILIQSEDGTLLIQVGPVVKATLHVLEERNLIDVEQIEP